jgi:signal transduction histidine kinase
LRAGLEWLVREFERRSKVKCVLTLPDSGPDIEPQCGRALFCALQESLNNIVKHAEAPVVEVDLSEDSGLFVLTVKDNGRGITEADLSKLGSFGLVGLRERLSLLGGSLRVSRCPRGGTQITAQLPKR